MLENLDGFIFRRNVRQSPKARRFLDEGEDGVRMERGKTDGIFSFRFVGRSKRKGDEECGDAAKKAKEDVCVEAKEEEVIGQEVELSVGGMEFCESVVIKEAPKKKMEVGDLHTKVGESGGIGALVGVCVEWVSRKKKTEYAMGLERLLREDPEAIKGRDVEKEIREADREIEVVDGEMEKWNGLKRAVMASNGIEVRELKRASRDFGYKAKMDEVRREFSEKALRLEFLKKSARAWVLHIREQSEELLRKVLETPCKERGVDTLFLLKALSRAGK